MREIGHILYVPNRHSGHAKPGSKNTTPGGHTVTPWVSGLYEDEADGNDAGKLKKTPKSPQTI